MISESSFQGALELALNAPGSVVRVQRINSGTALIQDERGTRAIRGARAGTADLIGFAGPDGVYLEIETKAAGGKPSDKQLARAEAVRRFGAVYLFVYADKYDIDKSVADAVARIHEAIAIARAGRWS